METITKVKLLDDSTPFSSRLNLPLLSNRKADIDLERVGPTPFSSMLNLPLLSSSQNSSTELRTNDPTPFSSLFKWPLLSGRGSNVELLTNNPTPLSSMLNLPLLSDSSTVAGGEVSTGSGSGRGSDNAVSKFIRQIITGEVQN